MLEREDLFASTNEDRGQLVHSICTETRGKTVNEKKLQASLSIMAIATCVSILGTNGTNNEGEP